ARTFSEVPQGAPFWYRNSLGLVELAVNRDSAASLLGLELGMSLVFS
ncbi:MAG: SAM-dependent chlorinase/fluorinase, partial [Candidatus Thiodiazotropha sp.]